MKRNNVMHIDCIDTFKVNYFYAIKIFIQFIKDHLGKPLNP